MKKIGCPVCSGTLSVRPAHGRKPNKLFIMLVCERNARHFRGFIADEEYVRGSGEGRRR